MTAPPPGLDTFLTALRFEGFPVGPHEIVRLQHVFSQSPPFGRHQLQMLLACTFVKHAEQQARFDALFDDWYVLARGALELPSAKPLNGVERVLRPPLADDEPRQPVGGEILAPPAASPMPDEAPKPSPWGMWVVILGVLLILSLGYGLWPRDQAVRRNDPGPSIVNSEAGRHAASNVTDTYWTWVPAIESIDVPWLNSAWLALALALLSLTSGAFLGWRYYRRQDIPPPTPPFQPGPAWLPLPEPDAVGPQMLRRDELREAVWRVERFVSEDLTKALDIDRTVTATAHAGGLPELHFQHAMYAREVWLWRDEMVQDAAVERLLDDIERSLTRAGLPVRCGTFTDTPGWVRWQSGEEFSPLALEGHRQSALVVIVTDGYGLQLAASSTLEQGALDNLLLAFGEWPRLVFVDISGSAYGLSARMQSKGLTCIAPEAIPAFLGGGQLWAATTQRADDPLLGDLRLWAAATALSPEPVTDETAFTLRDRLQLKLSPWALRDLLRMADGFGGSFDWSPERRAELLNWLTLCSCNQEQVAVKVEKDSPLDQALDYWLERYRDEDEARLAQESTLLPWSQTPVAQRRQIEIALLDLWRQPDQAVKSLYRLRRNLGDEIRSRLSGLAAWDRHRAARPHEVVLPWKLSEQPAYVRWMLARLGFGTGETDDTSQLKTPAALGLAWGICGGLALVSLGWLASLLLASGVPTIAPVLPEAMQQVVIQETYRTGLDTYDVVLGTPKALQSQSVPAHSTVRVRWQWTSQPNIQPFGQHEWWHAGTLPQPLRACDPKWPRRSLVVIASEPSHVAARQLATRLLDLGSADVVFIGRDWAQQLDQVIQDTGRTQQDQLVMVLPTEGREWEQPVNFQGAIGVVQTNDFLALANKLDFEGVEPLETIWQGATTQRGPLLRGLPKKTRDDETGITFVEVCGGTFTMGSDLLQKDKDGKDYFADEKPKHPVTLSTFEISQTEMTRVQYGQAGKDDGTLPAGSMTWHQAKAFCEKHHLALPTEAEWEYAARGGTTSEWSFGDDEKQLGNYAWFSGNRTDWVHPVGKKLPNPLGLRDMHGNAVEWVEDCYDADTYAKRGSAANEGSTFVVNPQIDKSCKYRVLRGGWSFYDPEDLRSANRGRDEPEDRDGDIGFRCVRRSRRQP